MCEIEKLKSKVYFLEAELLDFQAFKERIQSEQPIQDEDLKDIGDIKTSEIGDSPERFEIIDKSMVLFKRSSDLEDNVSNNSLNTSEWAKISIPEPDFKHTQQNYCTKEREFKDLSMETYVKDVYSLCYINVNDQADCSMLTILNKDTDFESLIHAISESLLKIIPNVILNKREEVIPLLMSAIYFNPNASERDKLLHQLFHLKKRPCENERFAILSAVIGIARKAEEQLVENEILPQCWLQLTHKYIERRLLVAQACTVLMPYVSSPIRNSLILSMLQQMLEDKEDEVREQILRALTLLFCHCEDPDKYPQCEQLAFNTFKDASNSVFNVSVQVLFPVLAKWALQAGYLTSSLFKKLLHRLNEHIRNLESQSKSNQEIDRIQRVLAVIDILLPFLVTSVAYYEDVTNHIKKEVVVPIRYDFSNLCSNKLTNPESFVKSDFYVGTVLHEFDKFIADNPNSSWASMDWVVDEMLPDLLNNLHHIDLAQQSLLQGFLNLFAHISIVFGHNFTKYKIRPIVQKNIQNVEQVISSFNQFCPSLNVIPIYVTVLRLTKDFDEISSIMKRFLCALPLCGSPLDCLEITVKKLCEAGLQNVVVECLWSGVVHQRPLVKSAAASLFCSIIGTCSEDLLKSNVAGAIVTLASDSDILVRTATIPALGRLITNCSVKEIHDKAYMQLQTFAIDPSLKENHTISRQLIVTLGNIFVGSCSAFRNDVILPQLTNFSIFMSQMTNQTRKIDMALALLEAFTHVVYSPLNNQNVSSVIRSGLKSLELVISENPSLLHHHETILAMLKECDSKCNQSIPGSPVGRSSHFGHNVNQGVEEMRQRVTKIFNKPSMPKSNTLPNLSGIFKKK